LWLYWYLCYNEKTPIQFQYNSVELHILTIQYNTILRFSKCQQFNTIQTPLYYIAIQFTLYWSTLPHIYQPPYRHKSCMQNFRTLAQFILQFIPKCNKVWGSNLILNLLRPIFIKLYNLYYLLCSLQINNNWMFWIVYKIHLDLLFWHLCYKYKNMLFVFKIQFHILCMDVNYFLCFRIIKNGNTMILFVKNWKLGKLHWKNL
jgi:hypothetical protein